MKAGAPAPSLPPPRDKRLTVGEDGVGLVCVVAGLSCFGLADAIITRFFDLYVISLKKSLEWIDLLCVRSLVGLSEGNVISR